MEESFLLEHRQDRMKGQIQRSFSSFRNSVSQQGESMHQNTEWMSSSSTFSTSTHLLWSWWVLHAYLAPRQTSIWNFPSFPMFLDVLLIARMKRQKWRTLVCQFSSGVTSRCSALSKYTCDFSVDAVSICYIVIFRAVWWNAQPKISFDFKGHRKDVMFGRKS